MNSLNAELFEKSLVQGLIFQMGLLIFDHCACHRIRPIQIRAHVRKSKPFRKRALKNITHAKIMINQSYSTTLW